MPKTVTLLKPFHFSRPPVPGTKLPTELKFYPNRDPKTKEWIPTEVDLDDDVANHEWVQSSFADGAIERPEVTKARLEAAHAKQKIENENNAAELARAEQALKRATGAHETQQRTEAKVAKELETPVNALGAQQGLDIDKAALDVELNTPVNELRANGGKAKAPTK